MTDSRAAVGLDRLPWLSDEPARRTARAGNGRDFLGWGLAALLIVAGLSYWLGMRTAVSPEVERYAPASTATSTVPAPTSKAQTPTIAEPQPAPVIEPVGETPSVATPRAERSVTHRSFAPRTRKLSPMDLRHNELSKTLEEQAAPEKEPAAPAVKIVPAPRKAQPLTAWPAWQSAGSYGRIVRIGAFGSREQAKLGWRYMVRAYPAVSHLQATVVETRNSRGRHFYRFQIGTTSQAHSEVLCQRMQPIHLSCAVVGLPWKPKGVER